MRDIIIITKEVISIPDNPYVDRIIVVNDVEELRETLPRGNGGTMYVGFQGPWWTWDDIQGILRVTEEHLKGGVYRRVQWLPDNWFLPESMLPEMHDAEEVYAWIQKQLA
jgi:hypothetical protein